MSNGATKPSDARRFSLLEIGTACIGLAAAVVVIAAGASFSARLEATQRRHATLEDLLASVRRVHLLTEERLAGDATVESAPAISERAVRAADDCRAAGLDDLCDDVDAFAEITERRLDAGPHGGAGTLIDDRGDGLAASIDTELQALNDEADDSVVATLGAMGAMAAALGVSLAVLLLIVAWLLRRKRRSEQQENRVIHLLESVAASSNQSSTLSGAIAAATQNVCTTMGWPVGHSYIVEGKQRLVPTGLWHCKDEERFAAIMAAGRADGFDPASGLPGKVLRERESTAVSTTDAPSCPRRDVAVAAGVKCVIGLPILIGDEVVGVLEFLSIRVPKQERRLLRVLGSIGTQLGRVAERERAAGELLGQKGQLAEAQRLAAMGSWEWNADTGDLTWSEALYELLGVTPGTDLDLSFFLGLVHPDDRPRVEAVIQDAYLTGDDFDYEARVVRPSGEERVIYARGRVARDSQGQVRMMGTAQDITRRKELEREIEHRAFHDSLTDLPNRALFLDRVEHALTRGQRSQERAAVLFIDLDDFKTVNDSLGHAMGDQLLDEVARRLSTILRPADTLARLGGDEFAILLESADRAIADVVASRVLRSLEQPFRLTDTEIFARASIGIALAGSRAITDEVMRNADVAMYAAKAAGKGAVRSFEPNMLDSFVQRLALKDELRRALDHGEFILHYQPVVALQTGRVESLEALVRWRHPERGLAPPGDFIPLAEETGLIVALGQWVCSEAARQAKEWQRSLGRPVSVSVNLSGRQLQEADIVHVVSTVLEETELEPQSLILEITETVVMRSMELSAERLEQLRSTGVRIAIDDFGTGYSSLGNLRELPVDIVKIDRSFVDAVARGPEDRAFAHAIVRITDTLGLRSVAEGVEDENQAAALAALGCDAAQGFFFSRPVRPEDVPAILTRGEYALRALAGSPAV